MILLIVIIDLWCCISSKIPENNPYYLHLSKHEEEQMEKIKKAKEEF